MRASQQEQLRVKNQELLEVNDKSERFDALAREKRQFELKIAEQARQFVELQLENVTLQEQYNRQQQQQQQQQDVQTKIEFLTSDQQYWTKQNESLQHRSDELRRERDELKSTQLQLKQELSEQSKRLISQVEQSRSRLEESYATPSIRPHERQAEREDEGASRRYEWSVGLQSAVNTWDPLTIYVLQQAIAGQPERFLTSPTFRIVPSDHIAAASAQNLTITCRVTLLYDGRTYAETTSASLTIALTDTCGVSNQATPVNNVPVWSYDLQHSIATQIDLSPSAGVFQARLAPTSAAAAASSLSRRDSCGGQVVQCQNWALAKSFDDKGFAIPSAQPVNELMSTVLQYYPYQNNNPGPPSASRQFLLPVGQLPGARFDLVCSSWKYTNLLNNQETQYNASADAQHKVVTHVGVADPDCTYNLVWTDGLASGATQTFAANGATTNFYLQPDLNSISTNCAQFSPSYHFTMSQPQPPGNNDNGGTMLNMIDFN